MSYLTFSPDGKFLATVNDYGAVEIWNVRMSIQLTTSRSI